MKLSKWGNSYALRIPSKVVEEKNLKLGKNVRAILEPEPENEVQISDAFKEIRKWRGAVPADYRFKRSDVYDD